MKIENLYCIRCDKFTLKKECSCKSKTKTTKPAKFSLEDRYGKWRRIFKKETLSGK